MIRTLGKRVELQPLVACGGFHTMTVTGGRSLSWTALKCCPTSRSPRLNMIPISSAVLNSAVLLVSEDSRSPWLDSSSHTLALPPFNTPRLAPVLSHQGHRRRALSQPKREVNKRSGEGNDGDAALSHESLRDQVATLFHRARGSGKWDSHKSVHVSIVMPTVSRTSSSSSTTPSLECAPDPRVGAHQGAAATSSEGESADPRHHTSAPLASPTPPLTAFSVTKSPVPSL